MKHPFAFELRTPRGDTRRFMFVPKTVASDRLCEVCAEEKRVCPYAQCPQRERA